MVNHLPNRRQKRLPHRDSCKKQGLYLFLWYTNALDQTMCGRCAATVDGHRRIHESNPNFFPYNPRDEAMPCAYDVVGTMFLVCDLCQHEIPGPPDCELMQGEDQMPLEQY